MITFQQAWQIAYHEIQAMNKPHTDCTIVMIGEDTMELPYAWVFFYTSKEFLETGDFSYSLLGNAPLFISKTDGNISTFFTSLSLEAMIDAYEEQHQVWRIELTENIYSDTKKLLDLKKVLMISNADLAAYKTEKRLILDSGAKNRLLVLQKALTEKNIHTQIIQQ